MTSPSLGRWNGLQRGVTEWPEKQTRTIADERFWYSDEDVIWKDN